MGQPAEMTSHRLAQLGHLVELAERLALATDLDTVLEAVADAAERSLAPAAVLLTLAADESGAVMAQLARGLGDPVAAWWTAQARPLDPTNAPTVAHPDWPVPLAPALVGLRVPLAVPGQRPVGVLDLFATDRVALDSYDPTIVQSIALQAAAAIATARARSRQVLAVYSVAQSVTGRIDLNQLAEAVLTAVVEQFGGNGGLIALAERGPAEPDAWVTVASLGADWPPMVTDALRRVCQHRPTPLIIDEMTAASAALGPVGSGLVAPLWLDRKLFGLMAVTFPASRAVRQGDLWLLSAVASQVTMALRNVQLYLWSEELAITEERSRIAREIHDGLAQSLAHKILKIEHCQRLIGRDEVRLRQELMAMKESVRADIQDVRHSILALRPLDLEQRGLAGAISAYVTQFSEDTGIAVSAQIGALDSVAPKAQTALFRLVQEALNNIRKHAQASQASVGIELSPDGLVTLLVSDNGRGFAVADVLQRQPGQSGIGLRGMFERVGGAGGTMHVDSQPGQGTRIRVSLPVR